MKALFIIIAMILNTVFASEIQIKIGGMSCEYCASGLEHTLGKIDGIKDVDVNYDTSFANIITTKDIPKSKIEQAIVSGGYKIQSYKILH